MSGMNGVMFTCVTGGKHRNQNQIRLNRQRGYVLFGSFVGSNYYQVCMIPALGYTRARSRSGHLRASDRPHNWITLNLGQTSSFLLFPRVRRRSSYWSASAYGTISGNLEKTNSIRTAIHTVLSIPGTLSECLLCSVRVYRTWRITF